MSNSFFWAPRKQQTPITHPFFIEDLLQSMQATDFGIIIRPKAIPMAYGALSPKRLPNKALAVSPNNPMLSSCKGDYLQTDHVGCFVLISARYRINPQITSSTTAPRSDRKKPAGWNFEPSGGLEMSRPISPPTSDPTIPRIDVRMNPICWAPGTMARAIRPTMNPTIIDQIMCNIVITSRLWDRLRTPL